LCYNKGMSNAYNPFADVETRAVEAPKPVLENPATDRQVAFLKSLLAEKDLTKLEGADKLDPTTLSKKGASMWIDALLKQPRQQVQRQAAPAADARPEYEGLRSGYYAVDGKRYKLDVVESGKWGGWIFLKTGSEYHDQNRMGAARPGQAFKGNGPRGDEVFEAILADPYARMVEYGQITGSCGACGRTLEDPESVALGIGPVCRSKF
jgi:hypothetical protein